MTTRRTDVISMFKSQIFCVLRLFCCVVYVSSSSYIVFTGWSGVFVFEFWGKSAVMWLSLCLVIGDHQLRPEQRPKFSVSQPHKTSSNAAVSKPTERKNMRESVGDSVFLLALFYLRFIFVFQHSLVLC